MVPCCSFWDHKYMNFSHRFCSFIIIIYWKRQQNHWNTAIMYWVLWLSLINLCLKNAWSFSLTSMNPSSSVDPLRYKPRWINRFPLTERWTLVLNYNNNSMWHFPPSQTIVNTLYIIVTIVKVCWCYKIWSVKITKASSNTTGMIPQLFAVNLHISALASQLALIMIIIFNDMYVSLTILNFSIHESTIQTFGIKWSKSSVYVWVCSLSQTIYTVCVLLLPLWKFVLSFIQKNWDEPVTAFCTISALASQLVLRDQSILGK